MIFDTHMHSEFSFDSDMTVSEILKKQDELKIGITLTEHVDLDLPELPFIDMDKYLSFYKNYKQDNFLVGIELGMSKVNMQLTKDFASKNKDKLDVIIGSIHTLYTRDLFYLMKDTEFSKEKTYKDYLENMLYCVKEYDFYDTLAHIDYICRYSSYEDKELHLHEYSYLINDILKTIIAKGKCLELNTRRLNNPLAYNSLLEIFKRYKELGGEYVTLASDSHSSDAIAINFDIASKILEVANLKSVYFKNRKMIIE